MAEMVFICREIKNLVCVPYLVKVVRTIDKFKMFHLGDRNKTPPKTVSFMECC